MFNELEVNWKVFVLLLLVKIFIVVDVLLWRIVFLEEFVRLIINVLIFLGMLLLIIYIEIFFLNFFMLNVICLVMVRKLLFVVVVLLRV